MWLKEILEGRNTLGLSRVSSDMGFMEEIVGKFLGRCLSTALNYGITSYSPEIETVQISHYTVRHGGSCVWFMYLYFTMKFD